MQPNKLSIDQAFLQKLRSVVLENLENEQFGVEVLSKKVGISRTQLHRKLKKLKSKSVSEFIREVRLQEAMKLLQQDVATASEISYRVGFSSPSYFFKCFQKYFGFPPGDVKKRNTEDPSSTEANQIFNEPDNHRPTYQKYKSAILVVIIFLFAIAITFFGFHYFKDRAGLKLEKSIAVLPFKSLSTDEENQHFTDGLVDDLLSRLALINELEVTSRTSSETFRDRDDMKIPKIATELGVSYLVEGSVQKYDDKVRIIVQLIDAVNDDHIWVKTFDRDLSDVYKVQSEIAMQVASGLSTALTENQTLDLQKNQTENVKAMELYQLGRFHLGKRTSEGLEAAIKYFQQAVAEDQNYALAYAGMADTYYLMGDRDKAEITALQALEIDPKLAEAYTVLATLNFFIDKDWAGAEKRFQQAFQYNSNYSTLHHRYSEFLSSIGNHIEARKHMNKAIELDPLSFVVRRNSTELYFSQGQFHEALAEAQISEDLNGDHVMPPIHKFRIHYFLGNGLAALKEMKRIERIFGRSTPDRFLDSIYNASGLDGLVQWRIDVEELTIVKAKYYNYFGDNDRAMDWLELAYNEGDLLMGVPYWYSPNNLHSHPRFIALMKKIGLPWKPD